VVLASAGAGEEQLPKRLAAPSVADPAPIMLLRLRRGSWLIGASPQSREYLVSWRSGTIT
jgi:hypothetical protein